MVLLKFMAKGRWHIGVLALALVLAQSIGLIHGIAHAPLLQAPVAGVPMAVHAAPAQGAADSFFDRLFGEHQDQNGNAQCHLFDQSNHLDGLCAVAQVALPTLFATALPVAFAGLFQVRWLAAFHARGPPSFH